LSIHGHRDLASVPLRQSEVHDVRFVVPVQHDIAGLEVSMNHTILMGMVQCMATLLTSMQFSNSAAVQDVK
jgi:hypothetical protein